MVFYLRYPESSCGWRIYEGEQEGPARRNTEEEEEGRNVPSLPPFLSLTPRRFEVGNIAGLFTLLSVCLRHLPPSRFLSLTHTHTHSLSPFPPPSPHPLTCLFSELGILEPRIILDSVHAPVLARDSPSRRNRPPFLPDADGEEPDAAEPDDDARDGGVALPVLGGHPPPSRG